MSVISEICVGERATVDPADPWTLKRVKLLGKKSGNKRTYSVPVQEAAKPLFRNKKIYVDHGDLDGKHPINRKRSYAERLGIVTGEVTVDRVTEATYGDVRLNPKHPLAEMVRADYDAETPGVGFSIAADCRFAGGTNVGECLGIDRIFSIDLVDDPATTISLTESLESETQYEQGKEHGEMRAKLEEHENRLAEHAKRHEEHQARLDGHDGEHRTHHERHHEHERRLSDLETEHEKMGGKEHVKAIEQWREKQAAAEAAVAEANKLVAESKEAFKKVPRTPNSGNPLENRIKTAAPITNGVGLQKPNFHKN